MKEERERSIREGSEKNERIWTHKEARERKERK